MTLREFHNALRLLSSIDRHEIEEAGYPLTESEWTAFVVSPWRAFIRANDRFAECVWSIIERRSRPRPPADVSLGMRESDIA